MFPKPTKADRPKKQPRGVFVSEEALTSYHDAHPRCEVIGCSQPAGPTPHHLVHRAQGRNDHPSKLASLCGWHHAEWHQIGGRRWFAKYQDFLFEPLRRKVMRALRMEVA